jgi:putative DNA primase/helicase
MVRKPKSDRHRGNGDRSPINISFNQDHSTGETSKKLTSTHQKDLQASGLTIEQMKVTGHLSADKTTAEKIVGYKLPGLVFSYCDPFGKHYLKKDGRPFYHLKPDRGNLKADDNPKYLSPKGEGCRPYFSRLYPNWEKAIRSPNIELWETEGEKKGDCGCAHGLAVLAFAGVNSWVDKRDRNSGKELSESRVLPELAVIQWRNRKVYQCFDSDIIEKQPVQAALAERAAVLKAAGAFPYLVLLPTEIDGAKNGLDDFIVRHGVEALKILAKHAQPTPLGSSNIKTEEGDKEPVYLLNLKEPEILYKAVMAWAVLKESWAFRPGNGWTEWQGTHWQPKTDEEFEAVLNQFMDAQNWCNRSTGHITSIIRELRSRLLVRNERWNPYGKIAFNNGTLDFNSGEFTPAHHQGDHITQLRPYNFSPTAKCLTWLRFLNEAMSGNKELIELIRAIFRYAVLPRPQNRKAEIEKSFDFFGPKGTGKGTTLDVLSHLVGSENIASIGQDTFKTATGLGQLVDKLLAVDYDASGFLSNVGVYNRVVSNEPVEVKKLYQDSYTTRLNVVVVRAYNEMIDVPSGSEGLDRRLTIIPFKDKPTQINTKLAEELEAELPGIFTWCYSMLDAEMKDRILSAGSIEAVAAAGLERFEANNPEFLFLCEAFPNGKESIKAGEVFRLYQEWCQNNGHRSKSQVKLSGIIQTLGCQRSKGKICGNYYYSIPKMANFDISLHLGTVSRQTEDSDRDSLKPVLESDRDSWRRLKQKSSKDLEEAKTEAELEGANEEDKSFTFQPCPTVPIELPGLVSPFLEASPIISIVSPKSRLKVGDRVRYKGKQFAHLLQDLELTIYKIKNHQASCQKPDKYYTTWINLEDLRSVGSDT